MALRICGLVGVALGILAVIYNLIRLIGVGAAAPRVGPGGPPPMLAVIMGFIVGIVLTVAWCVIVIKGADCMASLSGYGMAVAACIIAMLPCNPAFLGGLPCGIWGLVVLCNSDVKRAFR